MFFDTHAHYDDEKFDIDRDALLSSMAENGVDLILAPGTDVKSSRFNMKLSENYSSVYFAAGIHPHEASSADDAALSNIRHMLGHEKCVAVGEIGLDYHYDFSPRETQRDVFRRQMELAQKTRLPVIIHERESYRDTMDILRAYPDVRGVVHCFSGSWETAKEILSLGYMISFTGVVTFKNAKKVISTLENIPLDKMMLETDSPYMSPEPKRGERNSSLNLIHIARHIAGIRGVSTEDIAQITLENGKRFFGLA